MKLAHGARHVFAGHLKLLAELLDGQCREWPEDLSDSCVNEMSSDVIRRVEEVGLYRRGIRRH